jgi:hypothetical protein
VRSDTPIRSARCRAVVAAATPQHVDNLERPIGTAHRRFVSSGGLGLDEADRVALGILEDAERHVGQDGSRHDDASAEMLDLGERDAAWCRLLSTEDDSRLLTASYPESLLPVVGPIPLEGRSWG